MILSAPPIWDTDQTHAGQAGVAGRVGTPVVGDGTWLMVSEVVARLGGIVGEQGVRSLCDDGTLESVRVGRRNDRRIRATSVDAYLARLQGKPAEEGTPPASEGVE